MEEFNSAATAVSEVEAIGGTSHALILIVGLAFAGFIARLVIVSYGDRIAGLNPLRNASGAMMIFASFAMIAGGILYMNGHVKTWIMIRQQVIDPVIVSGLGRDSCDVASGSYCVVVFEEDREIVVNWHDKRINMMLLLTPPANPPWGSLRPQEREQDFEVAEVESMPADVPPMEAPHLTE